MRKAGRHDKKHRHAGEMARCLRALGQMDGILYFDNERLWVLAAPASPPAAPRRLAELLWADALPDRRTLQRALGCPSTHAVTSAQLAAWSRAWSELQGRHRFSELAAEGLRPLRKYRALDLPDQLARARSRLDELIRYQKAGAAALRCARVRAGDRPAVEDLLAALPLRLAALGSWPVDPLTWLADHTIPAERPLLALIRSSTTEPCLARLAALLLWQRHGRGSAASRQAIEAHLPASLRPVFRAGASLYGLPWSARLESLPMLSTLPPAEAARIGQVSDRVTQVFGLSLARCVCDQLTGPWLLIQRKQGQAPQVARRVLEVAQPTLADCQLKGSDPIEALCLAFRQERLFTQDYHYASSVGRLAGYALANFWPENEDLCDTLLYRIQVPDSDPLTQLAVVAERWQEDLATACREHVADPAQRDRLALCLKAAPLEMHLPPALASNHLRSFLDLAFRLPASRLRDCLAAFDSSFLEQFIAEPAAVNTLLESTLPFDLVRQAVRLGVTVPVSAYFSDAPGALHRYLECVQALCQDAAAAGQFTAEDWFARLFLVGRGWVANVVLALLGRVRQTNEAADAQRLHVLSELLGRTSGLRGLARRLDLALQAWDSPRVERLPAETGALAAALAVLPERLVVFLHYRRLAGQDEAFPQALLEPLHRLARDREEAAFLERRLADLPPDHPGRAGLARRLHNLTDPEAVRQRQGALAARARRRLDRSIQQLRRASLNRVLADVCRVCLERLLKRPLPESLTPRVLDALLLLQADWLDHDLLSRFLMDVLDGRSVVDWPANRAWLDQAAVAGVDVAAWLAGLDATATIEGQPVRFQTEHDPLRMLDMGNLFSTCLSLGHGCNAASTLTNAIEVNKQVIYGRTANGTVVARKLIGVTADGRLAGYHTYTNLAPQKLPQVLSGLLAELARRCHLQLSDSAVPEQLHPSAFWYDDGNEAWRQPGPEPKTQPPADVPADPDALKEWHLHQAREANDANTLFHLGFAAGPPWRALALFWLFQNQLLLKYPDVLQSCRERRWFSGRDASALTYVQGLSGADEEPNSFLSEVRDRRALDDILAGLPFDRPAATAVLGQLTLERAALLRSWLSLQADPAPLAPQLALAPLEMLLRFFGLVLEHCQPDEAWQTRAVDVLEIAWLRDQDPESIARTLGGRNAGLVDLLVRLAGRAVIPGAARKLRALLANCPADREDRIALALGTQGDPQDGERLLKRLRRRPESLPLAVAVARTRHPRAAQQAGELWQLQAEWATKLTEPSWVALVHEVGPQQLATRLHESVGKVRREEQEQGRVWSAGYHLRRLALLGLPGPDGEPAHLLERERLHPALWVAVEGCQRLWQDIRALDRHLEASTSGAASASILASWARLRERVRALGHGSLRHFPMERRLHWLAAHGTANEQTVALEQWLDMEDDPRSDWRPKLLAGLADSPEARLVLARRLLTLPQDSDGSGTDLILRVLASDRTGGMHQALEEAAAFYSSDWSAHGGWDRRLLALLSADPALAEAARTCLCLGAKRQPAALLNLLNQAFWILPAASVEQLTADVLPHLDVDSLWVKGLFFADSSGWPTSYVYQQWVLRAIWPRLSEVVHRAALDDLRQRPDQSERIAWLRRQLKAQRQTA